MGWNSRIVRLAAVVAATILVVGGASQAHANSKGGGAASSAAVGKSGAVISLSSSNAWAVTGSAGGRAVLHWNGQKWSAVTISGLNGWPLHSLAAASADSIWAVGTTVGPHGTAPLVLHWNGKRWARSVGVPAINGDLYSVAVVGQDVWAVGDIIAGTVKPPLILHLTAGHWYVVPSSAASTVLSALAMAGTSDGWAAGSAEATSPSGQRELEDSFLHWNGQVWKPAVASVPGNAAISGLAEGNAGQVWAVGTVGGVTPMSMHWNGKVWREYPFAPLTGSPGQPEQMAGVTAIPGGTAWSYGAIGFNFGEPPVIYHWSGKAWTETWRETSGGGALSGIGVESAASAWAVGYICTDLSNRTCGKPKYRILHWNGKTWNQSWLPG